MCFFFEAFSVQQVQESTQNVQVVDNFEYFTTEKINKVAMWHIPNVDLENMDISFIKGTILAIIHGADGMVLLVLNEK